jgi:hypothetical protein
VDLGLVVLLNYRGFKYPSRKEAGGPFTLALQGQCRVRYTWSVLERLETVLKHLRLSTR